MVLGSVLMVPGRFQVILGSSDWFCGGFRWFSVVLGVFFGSTM